MTFIFLPIIALAVYITSIFGFAEGSISKINLNIFENTDKNVFKKSLLVFANLFFVLTPSYLLLNKGMSSLELIGFMVLVLPLVFLISFDGLFFEIPALSTYGICILAVVIFILELAFSISIFPSVSDIPTQFYSFALAGSLYAFLYFFLWIVTNKKGMGDGDIYIAFATGLLLGPIQTLIAFYATIFVSLVFSLGVILKEKKVKGVKIPFVPFMGYGLLISLAINADYILALLF